MEIASLILSICAFMISIFNLEFILTYYFNDKK